jgi:heme o synthase
VPSAQGILEPRTDIAMEETSAQTFTKKTSRTTSFAELMKLRLSSLVVFSAVISFFTVADNADWFKVLMLFVGGFLITGASNGFNQIMERDLDKLMKRTQGRPLPTTRLNVNESLIFCFICAALGTTVLWFYTNPVAAMLGALSVVLYSLVYTPMKRITPFAVFVGAIPGALPPLIGAVAATSGFGEITFIAWLLFAVQFMWQFPHFWAIAWVLHDDYQSAGFFMLPSFTGRSKGSAFQILVYTLFLIPVSITPCVFIFHSWITGFVIFALGIWFLLIAMKLYKDCSIETARKLMFASFFYLPLVQLLILAGKWIQQI